MKIARAMAALLSKDACEIIPSELASPLRDNFMRNMLKKLGRFNLYSQKSNNKTKIFSIKRQRTEFFASLKIEAAP